MTHVEPSIMAIKRGPRCPRAPAWATLVASLLVSAAALAQTGSSSQRPQAKAANPAPGTPNFIAKFDKAGKPTLSSVMFDNGNVGIGTTAPDATLHVFGESGRVKAQAAPPDDNTQDNAAFVLANRGKDGPPYTWVLATAAVGGGFGINPNALEIWEYPQDSTPGCCLPRLRILPSGNQGSAPSAVTIMADGTLQTSVLQIVGGSDVAEPFEIEKADSIRPGFVVTIDQDRPGQLRLASKAYDRTVAGIVSGANGMNSGLTMKQAGTVADGTYPVALTGRVYSWADASYGPIEPGALLTTSDTPGHAMKATDPDKARGAIIGKAMTRLSQGKGLVLVLVTLQ